MDISKIIDFLKKIKVFSFLSDKQIVYLAESVKFQTQKKDSIYYKESINGLYIVMKGELGSFIDDKDIILESFCPGDFFGEFSFIFPNEFKNERGYSLKAWQDVELLFIPNKVLHDIGLMDDYLFVRFLMHSFFLRIMMQIEEKEVNRTKSVDERVLYCLTQISKRRAENFTME